MFRFIQLIQILLMTSPALSWNTPNVAPHGQRYTAWTWTGAGNDSSWTNGANWCGAYLQGVCQGASGGPPNGASLVFDERCQAYGNCTPSIPIGPKTFNGIHIASGFNGTLDFSSSNVTISNGGYYQAGGTFTKSSGTLTLNATGNFVLAGGTFIGGSGNISIGTSGAVQFLGGSFTSTSGTLTLNTNVDFSLLSSFNHASGTIRFNTGTLNRTINPGSHVFWNVSMGGCNRGFTFTNEFLIDGNFSVSANGSSGCYTNFNGSAINLRQGHFNKSHGHAGGNSIIKFTGNGVQHVDTTGSGSSLNVNSIQVENGMAGELRFIGDVYLNGLDDSAMLGFINLNGNNFSANNGTYNVTSLVFPELQLVGSGGGYTFTKLEVTDLILNGSTSVGTSSGFLETYGNVTVLGSGLSGWVNLELKGTGTQIINATAATTPNYPTVYINKPSGQVEFSNSATGQINFTGNFTFTTAGMSAGAILMPTISQINFTGTSGTSFFTSNGFQFPSTTTLNFQGTHSYRLVDNFVALGNVTLSNPSLGFLFSSDGTEKDFVVHGNITALGSAHGYRSNSGGATVYVRLAGSGQNVNCTNAAAAGCALAALQINSTGGTTTFTGPIRIYENLTHNTGTVNASGSTFIFSGAVLWPNVINVNTMQFGSVTFNSSRPVTISGGALVVNGDLSFANASPGQAITGAISVTGNVSSSGNGASGSASLTFTGNTDSTWTRNAAIPNGLITINKTAGRSVRLGSSVALASGQSVSVTGGSLDIFSPAHTLAISGAGSLTLAATTFVTLSGGQVTVGGTPLTPGPYSGGQIDP